MQQAKQRLTSCVVGGTSLALQCVRAWVRNGHEVKVVISSDETLCQWAQENKILCFADTQAIAATDSLPKFDYLFSIVNEILLTPAILSLPKIAAINYHDSLLPRYAGVHATSWAILNEEKTHGITWHMIDEGIDTGDILKQTSVDIDPTDTAFTLNMRCYEAAIGAFELLIDELAYGKLNRQPQDPTQRTYFGAHKKLPGNGLFSWEEDAQVIDKYYRAASLGNYKNRLGTLKVTLNNQHFVVRELCVLDTKSNVPPGQVVRIEEEALHISTKSNDIALVKVSDFENQLYEAQAFVERFKITLKTRFSSTDKNTQTSFSDYSTTLSKHESFWVKQIKAVMPVKLPYFEKSAYCDEARAIHTASASAINEASWPRRLIAALVTYIHRIQPEASFTLGYTDEALEKAAAPFGDAVETILPLTLTPQDSQTFEEVLAMIEQTQDSLKTHKSYLRDVPVRRPDINANNDYNQSTIPCSIIISDENPKHIALDRRQFILLINPKKNTFSLIFGSTIKEKSAIEKQLALMSGHLQTLLASATESPSTPISHLRLLTPAEERILIPQPPKLPKNHRIFQPLTALFQEQVDRYPNHIAVEHNQKVLSYAELNDKANQLAGYLQQQGAKPGEYIAICLPRSPECIISMLATLKMGGVYVPIDPEYPEERIRFILEDADIRYVLASKNPLASALPEATKLLLIEEHTIFQQANANMLQPVQASGEDLAYIMYTSGSTGQPKGVLVRQQGVTRLVTKQNYVTFTRGDSVTQIANVSFDGSTFEIWGSLLNAGTLRIIPEAICRDFSALSEYLQKNCDISFFPTSLFHQLAKTKPEAFDGLKSIVLGGEPANFAIIQSLLSRKKQLKLRLEIVNGYGPTENTTFSVCHVVDNLSSELSKVPIGAPICHTQSYILDSNQQALPAGALGELYLEGLGLAKGYLNRPETTRAAFIPNPFQKNRNGKLYKTGDIVKRLPDGNLLFIGRRDKQVKIRGFRIELGEIEHCLYQYPDVQQAVVLALGDKNQKSQQLVAYVVPKPNTAVSTDVLETFMARRLPNFMLPTQYVLLDSVPLNPNGKVDTKKLDEIRAKRTRKKCIAPQNALQETLLKVWQQTLGVEEMGITDNFFSLGGDSITSIQIASELRKHDLQIQATDLFKCPTIVSLAKMAKPLNTTQPDNAEQVLHLKKIPCTPIQEWFFEQNFSHPEQFSQSVYLELSEPLDIERFTKSLNALCQHHSVFNAQFKRTLMGWQQKIVETAQPITIAQYDLSDKTEQAIDTFMNERRDELHAQLALSRAPLARAAYFNGGEKHNNHLLLIVHHLIIDTTSWRILLKQLSAYYLELTQNKTPTLPPQNNDFPKWLTAMLQLAKSKSFVEAQTPRWLKQLSKPLALPIDFNKGGKVEGHCAHQFKQLSKHHSQKLLNVNALSKIRAKDVALAALTKTFCEWTKQSHFYCHLEAHGRERLSTNYHIEHTIGWFTAMFPLLINIEPEALKDSSALLTAIRSQGNIKSEEGINYGILHYLSKAKDIIKAAKANPPPVSFNYLGKFDSERYSSSLFKLGQQGVELISHPDNTRSHLIDIMTWFNNGIFSIRWGYSENHFKASTIQTLSERFFDHLIQILEEFEKPPVQYLTPDDFKLVEITQAQLNQNFTDHTNIENLLPASVMQQGLLFQSLYESDPSTYFVQAHWEHKGPLDKTAMRTAWEKLMERHPILRTCFFWENTKQPMQIVYGQQQLHWQTYDWSNLSHNERAKALRHFYKADIDQPFKLNQAPLFRVSVITLGDKSHRIIFSHHHILLDGWSLGILLPQLYNYYQPSGLTEPAYIYEDYFTYLDQSDTKQPLSFWSNYLEKFSGKLDLSFMAPTKLVAQHAEPQRKLIEITLPKALSDNINQFSKTHGISTNNLMQATWAILLHRYTRETDITFGMTFTHRNPEIPNIDAIPGLFINTLPFRIVFDKNMKGFDCLATVGNYTQAIMDNGSVSLADVQSQLKTSHNTLFDTLFIFENYPLTLPENVSDLQIDDATHYPMTLAIFSKPNLKLKLMYQPQKFDELMLAQFLDCYQNLLTHLMETPKAPVSELKLLSDTQEQAIIDRIKQSTQSFDHAPLLLAAFEKQVKKQPEATALIYNNHQLSYAELHTQSNQLAYHLKAQGVNPGDFIALYLERGFDMIIAILAVLKTGAAYIPIDQHSPKERMIHIINDSKASILLTQSHLRKDLQKATNAHFTIIELDTNRQAITTTKAVPLTPINRTDMAYIIYTSGSTGKPKGVPITHHNLARLFAATNALFHFNHEDVWTLFHSYAFDVSVFEMWGALFYGGKLVIVPYLTCRDPETFHQLLSEQQVTVLSQTPSAFQSLANCGMGFTEQLPLKLRFILFAGEKLEAQKFVDWALSYPNKDLKLVNMYGATELTVHATFYQLTEEDYASNQSITGKPFSDLQFYLLDDARQIVPEGMSGEIYVAGAGLAPGYLNQPTLNTKKFLPNPFDDKNKTLYKTGDLARRLPNGDLAYLGRIDTQVKLRGFRIELGEIEHQLKKQAGIQEAAVIIRKQGENQQLIAYLVPNIPKQSIDIHKISQNLTTFLPDYMVPIAYVLLEKLPININGKLDTKTLEEMDSLNYLSAQQTYNPPETPVESLLANIWQRLLPIETHIGIHDNFFALGGHSILALQLLSAITECFGTTLEIRTIFESPTIALMAKAIENSKTNPAILARNQGIPSPIIKLSHADNGPNLFLVHPVGGSIFWFNLLAPYLEGVCNLYGIQDPGLSTGNVYFSRMEEMADFYKQAILTIQPQGPFYLGGSSFGGTAAIEVAQQLQQQGEEIAFFASLDGWACYPNDVSTRQFLENNMHRQCKEMAKKLAHLKAEITQPLIDLHWHRAKLLENYCLKPIDFEITLFKSKETIEVLRPIEEPYNHWKKWTDKVTLVTVPGDHETMFYKPNVSKLGHLIAMHLDYCQEKKHRKKAERNKIHVE